MLNTQQFVEHEIAERAEKMGFKTSADHGRQGNVLTYRTYDSELKLVGSVSVHYEESYADIVGYSVRDSNLSFRYGTNTQNLVNIILERLQLITEKESESKPTSTQAKTGNPEAKADARTRAVSDAFPFAPLPGEDLMGEGATRVDKKSAALLDLDKDLPSVKGD